MLKALSFAAWRAARYAPALGSAAAENGRRAIRKVAVSMARFVTNMTSGWACLDAGYRAVALAAIELAVNRGYAPKRGVIYVDRACTGRAPSLHAHFVGS